MVIDTTKKVCDIQIKGRKSFVICTQKNTEIQITHTSRYMNKEIEPKKGSQWNGDLLLAVKWQLALI